MKKKKKINIFVIL